MKRMYLHLLDFEGDFYITICTQREWKKVGEGNLLGRKVVEINWQEEALESNSFQELITTEERDSGSKRIQKKETKP